MTQPSVTVWTMSWNSQQKRWDFDYFFYFGCAVWAAVWSRHAGLGTGTTLVQWNDAGPLS